MMDLIWIAALAGGALASLLHLCSYIFRKPFRNPPGPKPWPIVGNLHVLAGASLLHQTLAKLAQQYGPIIFLRFASKPMLIISSPALAKEILCTKDIFFCDRPYTEAANRIYYPSTFLLLPYGDQWRNTRKLCTLNFFSAKRLHETEYVRVEEISDMLQSLRTHSGQVPVNLGVYLGRCAANIVCRLLISQRNVELQRGSMPIVELVHEISVLLGAPVFGDFMPYLGLLDLRTKRRMDEIHRLMDTFLEKVIAERRVSCINDAVPKDFLDALLQLKEDGEVNHVDVKAILMDLIVAGVETTSITMEWILAELIYNPSVLQRLRNEVNSVVEETAVDKLMGEKDVAKLSYMRAVVKETFRLHPVVPLLLPHMSRKACQVGGYDVPERTRVAVNVWAIGRSREVWGEKCEEFIPERFLEDDKRHIDYGGLHFELTPFGAGRRMCLGLSLGMRTIDLMLPNIVRSFDLRLPEGQNPKDMNMRESPGSVTNRRVEPLIVVAKLHSTTVND